MLLPRRPVPELRVPTLAHGDFDLAAHAPKLFTLISFYRGLHCPVCLKYLRDLEALLPEYERRGTKVIAISSDVPERAQEMARKVGPSLRCGHSLPLTVARKWGLYISASRGKTSINIEEPSLFFGARRIPGPTGRYSVLRRSSNDAVRTSAVLGIASGDRLRHRQ